MTETLRGGCHCGSIGVEFETALPIASLPLRACACSFCRRHGARTTSDPGGRVRLSLLDPANLSRYRFGFRTAEFFLCRNCGAYVAAVLGEGSKAWAVVNVNALDRRAEFDREAEAVDYAGESDDTRRARRRTMWTPAVIEDTAQR